MIDRPADLPLMELRGIVKRFGDLTANDEVALSIAAGELHALLGENGAGKSTLVKIMYGLLAPDAGDIRWRGQPMVLPTPEAARRLGIGMVFQHFSLFESMTVLDNVALGSGGWTANDALRQTATDVARRYGLQVNLDRPVWTLSAGERQRIEILRCLLQNPKLIVLDEPTSVLTPAEADRLFETLRSCAAEGSAVLFISHKLDEVRRLCSRATILRRGRVVAEVDPRAESVGSLAALMVGETVGDVRHATTTAGPSRLAVENLNVEPGTLHGRKLTGIDLEVRAGEVVCIAGVAGNGQAELFAVLSGESGPVGPGSIRLDGVDVSGLDITARRRAGAAFVPEQRLGHATLPTATLSENLTLCERGRRRFMLDRRGVTARLRTILTTFDVRAARDDPPASTLSGGNLQKYVLGRELIGRPGVMVVDQPTWGVDAGAALTLRQGLLDLAASGSAVLVISQDLDEVFALADRIAVINGGRLSGAVATKDTSREAIGLLMTTAGHGGASQAAETARAA